MSQQTKNRPSSITIPTKTDDIAEPSLYIFVPDTPVISKYPEQTESFKVSPHQRIKISSENKSPTEIKELKRKALRFINVNNEWWIHYKAILTYVDEYPEIFNISKLEHTDILYEFIADSPVLSTGYAYDFPISPHKCQEVKRENITSETKEHMKWFASQFVKINQMNWWIHKKALPLYIKRFPFFFNVKFSN